MNSGVTRCCEGRAGAGGGGGAAEGDEVGSSCGRAGGDRWALPTGAVTRGHWKWSDSACILKERPRGFPDRLDVGCQRKKSSENDWSSWLNQLEG